MPTYDYECKGCGHRFQEFQRITADPLTDCPECKASTLKRLIGAGGGVIFKGSGFYVTDYGRSGQSSDKGTGGKSESSSSGTSSESGGDKSCGTCGDTGPNVCD